MNCKIEVRAKKIAVKSDYCEEFITEARKIGGKWVNPDWVFDSRDYDDVIDLCARVYGYGDNETVDVQVEWQDGYSVGGDAIRYGNVLVARAFNRDSGAITDDGIKVLKGGFISGGSIKNWTTEANPGTTILIRDLPKSLFQESCLNSYGEVICTAKIVSQAEQTKEQLLARLEKAINEQKEVERLLLESEQDHENK